VATQAEGDRWHHEPLAGRTLQLCQGGFNDVRRNRQRGGLIHIVVRAGVRDDRSLLKVQQMETVEKMA